jgi:hypothetical protein
VRIDRGDNQGFVKAFSNMPLVEGSRLSTEADGRAEAEFEDGSTIRLAGNSTLDFQQLQLGKNGEHVTTVSLEHGEAYFGIKKKRGNEFTLVLDALAERLQVKKDSHFRVTADKDGVKVAEFSGELELVKPNGEQVKIGKNESLTLEASDPQRYLLAHGTTAEPLDAWDRERDQRQTMTVNSQNLGYNAVYNTAMNLYGYADLARYGNYTFVPGFGYVWRPYYESAYWDPFQNGAWMWYPQYNNYVFVSAYPWGWQPFHYGSWVNVPGVGWCWRPGGSNHFAPVAGVVNPPTGFRPIHPPRPGRGVIVPVGQGFSTIDNPNRPVGVNPTHPVGNGIRQGHNGAAVPMPSVRPIQTMNPVRTERPTRIEPMRPTRVEPVRPMPAPMRTQSAPPAMRPMSAPPRMAPVPTPAAPASHGGAQPRTR